MSSVAIYAEDEVNTKDLKLGKKRKRRGNKSKTSRNGGRGHRRSQAQRPDAHGRTAGEAISGITIYMEGGGSGRDTLVAIRQGMEKFLAPLKETSDLRVVPCGARSETFKRFRNAIKNEEDRIIALLVDAEDEVKGSARSHLQANDSWDLKDVSDDVIHLMAQIMETWIVADPDALEKYYGQGFQRSALPEADDLETVAKTEINDTLAKAIRETRKDRYKKIEHASDLLKQIDREKVKKRCRHCRILFDTLLNLIHKA